MESVDLNLLVVLDALLQEGSVTGAARRLHLTPPAVSRSLGRLRRITGDPLLVRAGRNLVPTPVAERMRQPTREAVLTVHELLSPSTMPSDEELEQRLDRTFTLRAGPDNAAGFGPRILDEMRRRAPRARLALAGDGSDAVAELRDGAVDLVIGTPIPGSNETIHRQRLLTDTVVVVGRTRGALARACRDRDPSIDDVARLPHVIRAPESSWHREFDERLADAGLARAVVASAPGFAAAFALVRSADLLCLAPDQLTRQLLGKDLRTWPAPVPLPRVVIEQAWHHRNHTDPEHRWLRARVRAAVVAGE